MQKTRFFAKTTVVVLLGLLVLLCPLQYSIAFANEKSQLTSTNLVNSLIEKIKRFEERHGTSLEKYVYQRIGNIKNDNFIKDIAIYYALPTEIRTQLQAIVKQEIAEQQQIMAQITANSSKTTSTKVVRYYQENYQTALQIKAKYDALRSTPEGKLTAQAYRSLAFSTRVKHGGQWDLKQASKLGLTKKYMFQGKLRTGEYIGNHHYGYIGRVLGYSQTTLLFAIGMYQIYYGTANWGELFLDDPEDTSAVKAGCALYDSGYRF